MAKKKIAQEDLSTEEKIKEAARVVFTKKGYAATRTRDIAEEAGINLALLNYYFRSKEKLFDLIMMEKMGKFFGAIFPVIEDTKASLEEKFSIIANNYIELLIINPDLPLFILSEMRASSGLFASRLPVGKLAASHLMKQIKVRRPDLPPTQFLMNLVSLCVFPFIMKPVLEQSAVLTEKAFHIQMNQRKQLIPKWIDAMLKAA